MLVNELKCFLSDPLFYFQKQKQKKIKMHDIHQNYKLELPTFVNIKTSFLAHLGKINYMIMEILRVTYSTSNLTETTTTRPTFVTKGENNIRTLSFYHLFTCSYPSPIHHESVSSRNKKTINNIQTSTTSSTFPDSPSRQIHVMLIIGRSKSDNIGLSIPIPWSEYWILDITESQPSIINISETWVRVKSNINNNADGNPDKSHKILKNTL